MKHDELLRYSRQIILPEFGYEGQVALQKSKVLVVGLGGLGCPVVLYLAASGVGKLILIDNELVDIKTAVAGLLELLRVSMGCVIWGPESNSSTKIFL